MFETFIATLQKGGTLPNFVTGGYDKDYVRSSPFGAGATHAAINAAKPAMQAMKNGDAIFVGPIKDNTGKQVVPAGTILRSLCRRTAADQLSDRRRHRLDHLIGPGTALKPQGRPRDLPRGARIQLAKSELEARRRVDDVALERVFGVELAIPLREQRQRCRGAGAERVAHDRTDAVNARLE